MLPDERRERIAELVTARDGCSVSELAAELDVSETTIRRDLDELAERNSIDRTHGGAMPVVERMSAYEQRTIRNRGAKEAIAQPAVEEIHEGQAVLFDAGSTTLAVSRKVPEEYQFSAVTNNPPAAHQLDEGEAEVRLTGGRYMKEHHLLVGRLAEMAIEGMNFDLAFVGLEGIDADGGLTTAYHEAARIKELMVANSRRVVVVADHSKFGSRSIVQFCEFSEVDVVTTDLPVPGELFEVLLDGGVEVVDDLVR
jgi:DeoR family fructose operon transcriptional repressor